MKKRIAQFRFLNIPKESFNLGYNEIMELKIKILSMDKQHCRLSFQNWTKSDIVVYEQVRRNKNGLRECLRHK